MGYFLRFFCNNSRCTKGYEIYSWNRYITPLRHNSVAKNQSCLLTPDRKCSHNTKGPEKRWSGETGHFWFIVETPPYNSLVAPAEYLVQILPVQGKGSPHQRIEYFRNITSFRYISIYIYIYIYIYTISTRTVVIMRNYAACAHSPPPRSSIFFERYVSRDCVNYFSFHGTKTKRGTKNSYFRNTNYLLSPVLM